MLKRDELKLPFSCLNRAADDEPIFVLRAHDPLAADAVRHWANQYRERKLDDQRWGTREIAKHAEALMLADAMADWYAHNAAPKPKQRANAVPTGDAELRQGPGADTSGHDRTPPAAPSREAYEAAMKATEKARIVSADNTIMLVTMLRSLLEMLQAEGQAERSRNERRAQVIGRVCGAMERML